MKHILFIVLCTAGLFSLSSCDKNTTYSHYQTLPTTGWLAQEWLTYDIAISDSTAHYDTFFYIRHNTSYPYQNLWLFVNKTAPNGTVTSDTLEFYLADQRGQWLGSGVSSIREMPVVYESNWPYSMNGNYQIAIQHGMRDTLLKGIQDVGVKMIKREN